MRVALVHDYFTQRGGAERVAAHLARICPDAAVHTSVFDTGTVPPEIGPHRLRAAAVQRLHRAGAPLRTLGPLLQSTFASMDLGGADVVISSSSAFAHHIRVVPPALHVCYFHCPAPFLWTPDRYFSRNRIAGAVAGAALWRMRQRDRFAVRGVDIALANSRYTAERLRQHLGIEARVVHPPIETRRFTPVGERSGRYLVVSRLRPHKAIDLAIAAANSLALPLDIVGDGSDRARLESLAGPSVRFLGRLGDTDVAGLMARCTALVVPGIEDFGMVMAEVQAAGRPPVAIAAGGALEIIRDGETGFLARMATPAALGAAMQRAAETELDTGMLTAAASGFDGSRFDCTIEQILSRIAANRSAGHAVPVALPA